MEEQKKNTPREVVEAILVYWNTEIEDDSVDIYSVMKAEGIDENFISLVNMFNNMLDGIDRLCDWMDDVLSKDGLGFVNLNETGKTCWVVKKLTYTDLQNKR